MTGDAAQPDHDALFDAFLDGELAGEEQARFEREMVRDPELRARVERAREIEGQIRAAYGAEDEHAAPIPMSARPRRLGGMRTARAVAYAAVVVLAVGGWWVWGRPAAPTISADGVYERQVAAFEPKVVCDTQDKFRAYTLEHLGHEFGADLDAGVTFVGWKPFEGRYGEPGGGVQRRVLLARDRDGREVIVVFQRAGDPRPMLDDGSARFVHRGRVGPVRVFEISVGSDPAVIPLLRG